MSERTMIISTYREHKTSHIAKSWSEKLSALLIRTFDSLTISVARWTNF